MSNSFLLIIIYIVECDFRNKLTPSKIFISSSLRKLIYMIFHHDECGFQDSPVIKELRQKYLQSGSIQLVDIHQERINREDANLYIDKYNFKDWSKHVGSHGLPFSATDDDIEAQDKKIIPMNQWYLFAFNYSPDFSVGNYFLQSYQQFCRHIKWALNKTNNCFPMIESNLKFHKLCKDITNDRFINDVLLEFIWNQHLQNIFDHICDIKDNTIKPAIQEMQQTDLYDIFSTKFYRLFTDAIAEISLKSRNNFDNWYNKYQEYLYDQQRAKWQCKTDTIEPRKLLTKKFKKQIKETQNIVYNMNMVENTKKIKQLLDLKDDDDDDDEDFDIMMDKKFKHPITVAIVIDSFENLQHRFQHQQRTVDEIQCIQHKFQEGIKIQTV